MALQKQQRARFKHEAKTLKRVTPHFVKRHNKILADEIVSNHGRACTGYDMRIFGGFWGF